MTGIGTKMLLRDITGSVVLHSYQTHLRVTSKIVAVVESLDLEPEGFDAFLEGAASDAEFGALIRQGLDRTRVMAFEDDPYGKTGHGYGKKLTAWQNRAMKATGKSRMTELHKVTQACSCVRTRHFFLFVNTRKAFDWSDGFSTVPDTTPDYREFLLDLDADDRTLGESARAALDAMVR